MSRNLRKLSRGLLGLKRLFDESLSENQFMRRIRNREKSKMVARKSASRSHHCFALALLTAFVFAGNVHGSIPTTERQSLINLYDSTNGEYWGWRSGWLGAPGTECSWFAVKCDAAGEHVISIKLAANRLIGIIPSLDALSHLEHFDVSENSLTGPIPTLDRLANLSVFAASQNLLSGEIPSLAGMTNLSIFTVAENALTGPIPSLSGLTNLYIVFLDDNQLTGSIPSLDGLTSLGGFSVAGNQLTGSIPTFAGLVSLESFSAASNQLTGSIPSLGSGPNFNYFSVADNHLTGTIPSLEGHELWFFEVGGNQLTGEPPDVPIPNFMAYGSASLCPNALNPTPSPSGISPPANRRGIRIASHYPT